MLRSTSPFDTEYNYDHHTSSRPTSSSSSPLHFLYPVMHSSSSAPHASSSSSPFHHHHHHHSHTLSSSHHTPSGGSKRTSRAADISRLLDPAYSPTKHRHDGDRSAYVDTHGDLHDPDFRHFPTADKFVGNGSGRTTPTQRRRHQHRARSPRRPHWETIAPEAHDLEQALTDEEEEEDLLAMELGLDDPTAIASAGSSAFFLSHPRYTSNSPRRSSFNSRFRGRDASFSTYSHGYSGATTTTALTSPTYYSPAETTSTLPTSYESESDGGVLSTAGDWDEKESTKKRRRLSRGESKEEKREKERDREFRRSIEATRPVFEELEDSRVEEEKPRDDDEEMILGGDYVPTCTQGLRRQWQALSLRFRFGVFRAQRRMMRRVQSML